MATITVKRCRATIGLSDNFSGSIKKFIEIMTWGLWLTHFTFPFYNHDHSHPLFITAGLSRWAVWGVSTLRVENMSLWKDR